MDILSIIEHKRDKKELTKNEIDYFVKEYTIGNVPDYKASALIMAIYLNGMNDNEISNLTMAMAHSGQILDMSDISDIIIDKHSTGGVGDKITIILMPIIASLGIPVAKMSGRGLGFTGGTADKLEAIPGYNVDIDIEEFKQNVKDIGISLITSNLELAPADKKIYALRDTIGCVSSIPLIASSIMSKKIAAGSNKIIIDITCGNGAFMKNKEQASILARTMIDIGKNVNREVRCILTDMNEPVGYAIGNQLEIIESIKALKGDIQNDVREIVYCLGQQILIMAKKAKNVEAATKMIDESINNGKAFEKFKQLVLKQGGDITYIDNIEKFSNANYIEPVLASKSGNVNRINAEAIGRISSYLGAGRINKEDKIDYKAGIIMNKKIGDYAKKDEPIAFIHTNLKDKIEEAKKQLQEAITISGTKIEKGKSVIEIIQ